MRDLSGAAADFDDDDQNTDFFSVGKKVRIDLRDMDYISWKRDIDCSLSYEPENAVARELYRSLGFIENGEMDGDEIVAVLKL